MIKGLKFKKKKAACFGSYGWSGDAVKQLSTHLQEAGIEVVNEGIRKLWVPNNAMLEDCKEFGKEFAKAL